MDRLHYSIIFYDSDFRTLMNRYLIDSDWKVEVNVYRCRSKKIIQAWRLFKCNPWFQSELVRFNHLFSCQSSLQSWLDDYPDVRFRI